MKNVVIKIREMNATDRACFPGVFKRAWLSDTKNVELWQSRFHDHETKKRIVSVLEENEKPVGYCTLLYESAYPYFKAAGIPEINDLWVIPEYRNKGYATRLIHHLENCARQAGYTSIGLGVGLYKDYGVAQKLYPKLGYIPDGNGITYHNKPVIAGDSYPVDDDLLLWLVKTL